MSAAAIGRCLGALCLSLCAAWAWADSPSEEPQAAEDSAASAPAEVDEKLQKVLDREVKKLRKQVRGKVKKGKGEFFAIVLVETTYHTRVHRTEWVEELIGDFIIGRERTNFNVGGGYQPVPEPQFQVVEGLDAAVTAIVDHMTKYIRLPAPKRQRDEETPAGPPPAEGAWDFFGRFEDDVKAEEAIDAARARYEAEPRWKITDLDGEEAEEDE